MAKTFIFNNQKKVNSYGFRVLNFGLGLDRFNDNPIMLDDHKNSTKSTLGTWENILLDGDNYKADTVFDNDDPDAKFVGGKVDRNVIKACSMGISFDWADMVMGADGVPELTKCELFEISICAVPSNAGCIALYSKDGELIPEDQIKLSLSALTKTPNKLQLEKPMEKIVLTAVALVALGLKNADDVIQVSTAIEKLSADHATLKTEKTELQAKYDALELKSKTDKETRAEKLVGDALLAGKITALMQPGFKTMALDSYDVAKQVLDSMPAKTTLSGKVVGKENTEGLPADLDATKIKTADDFEKLSDSAKLAFKAEFPEQYKAVFS